MKVDIKYRPLASGRRSVYLEYYEKGFRRREYLHLFLEADEVAEAKQHNQVVLKKAQEIRSERILNPPTFGRQPKGEMPQKLNTLTWLDYVKQYAENAEDEGNCAKMIQHKKTVVKHISSFLEHKKKMKILLKDVKPPVIADLFYYMKNTYRNHQQIKDGGQLSTSTLVHFQETVRAVFNRAIREELLTINPVNELKYAQRFHAPDPHREHLTVEELQRFLAVEPPTVQQWNVQHAFGFASMTGIRLGDMRWLKWSNIKVINGQEMVSIIQHKTGNPVTIPLNELAISLLPEKPSEPTDEPIFKLSKKPDCVAILLRKVSALAGLEKDFTFHSSRHTAATLAITAGAELYSVSKILGHASSKATQVYAKVDMNKKIEAVNLTNGVFH